MIEGFGKRVAIIVRDRSRRGPRQESDLADRRSVIEGPLKSGTVAAIGHLRCIDVLGPVPVFRLVREDIVRDFAIRRCRLQSSGLFA